MASFHELVPQKKLVPLTKQQIRNLQGGDFFGERIFIYAVSYTHLMLPTILLV